MSFPETNCYEGKPHATGDDFQCTKCAFPSDYEQWAMKNGLSMKDGRLSGDEYLHGLRTAAAYVMSEMHKCFTALAQGDYAQVESLDALQKAWCEAYRYLAAYYKERLREAKAPPPTPKRRTDFLGLELPMSDN